MSIDTIIVVDWSARSSPSSFKPQKDAIFLSSFDRTRKIAAHPEYYRTRVSAMERIYRLCEQEMAKSRRVLIGFDFSFAYPQGFAKHLTGTSCALSVWDWLGAQIEDAPDNQNNRFDVAKIMNAKFPGIGPFWGAPPSLHLEGLPHKGRLRHGHGLPEYRYTERLSGTAQSTWKLFTTGAVGSQALLGIYHLQKAREYFGDLVSIYPFEGEKANQTPIIFAEIYPSIFDLLSPPEDAGNTDLWAILDVQQVYATSLHLDQILGECTNIMDLTGSVSPAVLKEEGWILGVPPE